MHALCTLKNYWFAQENPQCLMNIDAFVRVLGCWKGKCNMKTRFKSVKNFDTFINTASFAELVTLYSIATGIPLSALLMGPNPQLPSDGKVKVKLKSEETRLTEFLNK